MKTLEEIKSNPRIAMIVTSEGYFEIFSQNGVLNTGYE